VHKHGKKDMSDSPVAAAALWMSVGQQQRALNDYILVSQVKFDNNISIIDFCYLAGLS